MTTPLTVIDDAEASELRWRKWQAGGGAGGQRNARTVRLLVIFIAASLAIGLLAQLV